MSQIKAGIRLRTNVKLNFHKNVGFYFKIPHSSEFYTALKEQISAVFSHSEVLSSPKNRTREIFYVY